MENKRSEYQHSKSNMVSFGVGQAANQLLRMAFAAFSFFYYEVEIGLSVVLVGVGYIIFAIWNAINDPLIGHLTNRPFKFTKKWGRRFPWVMIGGVPWVFSYILIFTPPNVDPTSGALIIFAWLVFTTCLFDFFQSIWSVNYFALFPDKYRDAKERRTGSGIMQVVGMIGVFLGGILPPLFVTFGDLRSYVVQGLVVGVVSIILLCLSAPGCRDDQLAVDQFLEKYDKATYKVSFSSSFKTSFKQKAYMIYIVLYIAFQAITMCMQASIAFVIRFVLEEEARTQIFVQIGLLLGTLISIPIWLKIAKKLNNNKKVVIIAGILMTVLTIPLIFVNSLIYLIITLTIWGVSLGGFWVMTTVIFADTIDDTTVNTGKREEGLYSGIRTFYGRMGIIIQAVTFTIVHIMTGFVEGSDTQTPTATAGILLHFALIPMIYILIGTLIFWKWYPLTPEKVMSNHEKLKELKL